MYNDTVYVTHLKMYHCSCVHIMCVATFITSTCLCRHNDLAEQIRADFSNRLEKVDLTKNSTGEHNSEWQTDIPRLQAGHVGGQVSA